MSAGVDKKKIKSRLTSKKRVTESCVEKCEQLPVNEVSMQNINSVELSELQELLRQKRSQLADEKLTTATGDLDTQQTEGMPASMRCTVCTLW